MNIVLFVICGIKMKKQNEKTKSKEIGKIVGLDEHYVDNCKSQHIPKKLKEQNLMQPDESLLDFLIRFDRERKTNIFFSPKKASK